jgi:hypothetical protein
MDQLGIPLIEEAAIVEEELTTESDSVDSDIPDV